MSRALLERSIEPLRQYEIRKCRTMWLQKYTCFLVIWVLLQSVVHGGDEICTKFPFGKSINATYHCENLSDLNVVDEIPRDVKKIIFEDSNLQHIHGDAFFRFGQTLISLDIHNSKVATIDSNAFAGLRNLETLYLHGNDLKYVYAVWFTDLSNLRTLDVSFNLIEGFELDVYRSLPNLENLYFDGNLIKSLDWTAFDYMPKLKRVIMGNNPWIWSYRALLMNQLDARGIDHDDDWEDWKWINAVIWECYQKIQPSYLNHQILDCAAMKLLTFVNENLKFQNLTSSHGTRCHPAASRLIACSRSNSSNKTDEEAVGMSLREIFHGIKSMEYPEDEFRLQ